MPQTQCRLRIQVQTLVQIQALVQTQILVLRRARARPAQASTAGGDGCLADAVVPCRRIAHVPEAGGTSLVLLSLPKGRHPPYHCNKLV
jgi:hypothetical protein